MKLMRRRKNMDLRSLMINEDFEILFMSRICKKDGKIPNCEKRQRKELNNFITGIASYRGNVLYTTPI